MTEVIIDNEFATMWYHPEQKIVHNEFHTFVYGGNYRNVMSKGLELLRENGCEKWLSDHRCNPTLHPLDRIWNVVTWNPGVIEAGWKYWALVMPEKSVGYISMKRWIDEVGDLGVEVYVCDDPDEALKWLESQGETADSTVASPAMAVDFEQAAR